MTLAAAGEFGLIARVTARLGTAPTTLVGPGDDAAVVAAGDGRVVVSTDVLVEGRHFRTDWASAVEIGHRAAAANFADVAAMGGGADGAAGGAVPSARPGRALGRSVGRWTGRRVRNGRSGRGRRRHLVQLGDHHRGDGAGRPGGPRSGVAFRRPAGRRRGDGGPDRIGGRGPHGAVPGLPLAEAAGRGLSAARRAVRRRTGRGGHGRHRR